MIFWNSGDRLIVEPADCKETVDFYWLGNGICIEPVENLKPEKT